MEECVRRLLWKEGMERKGLRVNTGKTKIMICGTGLNLLQSPTCCQGGCKRKIEVIGIAKKRGAVEGEEVGW